MEEPLPVTEFGEAVDPLADYLAQFWGITLGKDMVVDLSSNQPYVAVSNQYGDSVISNKMQDILTIYPTARSVQADQSMTEARLLELVLTSERSWAETDLDGLEAYDEGQAESSQPEPNEGVDLIGPISVGVTGEDETKGTRLVVFGDSEFASDAYYAQYGNGDMMINSVDWAAEQEGLISLTPKENTKRLIIHQRATHEFDPVGISLCPSRVGLGGRRIGWGAASAERLIMIRRSTWIILGIFILLILIVIIWQRVHEDQQAKITPTPATSYLFDLAGESITGIEISSPGGRIVSASKNPDGSWTLEEPAGEPADSGRIDSAVGFASGLQVISTLAKVGDLETLGLNPASYQIVLTLQNKTRSKVFIGGLTPTQNGYNVLIEGQPLKIVERYSLEEVLSLFDDPPILRPTPIIEEPLLPAVQP
jgi:hypothetical protein